MTDHPEDHPDTKSSVPIFNMREARKKFRPEVDTGRKSRKAKMKTLDGAVDKRSLRETGRTAQFNFKAVPSLKDRAQKAAALRGLKLAEWMEEAIQARLEAEGVGKDD
jgi:hypothetical protein